MPYEYAETTSAVAQFARAAFGGNQRVRNYYDDGREVVVPILECQDAPAVGMSTVSTLSVHGHPNLLDNRDVRMEFLMVSTSPQMPIGNILASAALNVIKDTWLAAPGVVYPGIVRDYVSNTTTPHLMWGEPQDWPELSSAQVEQAGLVHWLQAVPISESERRYLVERGYVKLESRLADHHVEFRDLHRVST